MVSSSSGNSYLTNAYSSSYEVQNEGQSVWKRIERSRRRTFVVWKSFIVTLIAKGSSLVGIVAVEPSSKIARRIKPIVATFIVGENKNRVHCEMLPMFFFCSLLLTEKMLLISVRMWSACRREAKVLHLETHQRKQNDAKRLASDQRERGEGHAWLIANGCISTVFQPWWGRHECNRSKQNRYWSSHRFSEDLTIRATEMTCVVYALWHR